MVYDDIYCIYLMDWAQTTSLAAAGDFGGVAVIANAVTVVWLQWM